MIVPVTVKAIQFTDDNGVARAELPHTPYRDEVLLFIDGVENEAIAAPDEAYRLQRNGRNLSAEPDIITQTVTASYWAYLADLSQEEQDALPDTGFNPEEVETPVSPDIVPVYGVGDFWPDWSDLDFNIDGYDPAVELAPECYGDRPDCIAALRSRLAATNWGITEAFNAQ